MVKDDNNRRQQEVDKTGYDLFRRLNVSAFLTFSYVPISGLY